MVVIPSAVRDLRLFLLISELQVVRSELIEMYSYYMRLKCILAIATSISICCLGCGSSDLRGSWLHINMMGKPIWRW